MYIYKLDPDWMQTENNFNKVSSKIILLPCLTNDSHFTNLVKATGIPLPVVGEGG